MGDPTQGRDVLVKLSPTYQSNAIISCSLSTRSPFMCSSGGTRLHQGRLQTAPVRGASSGTLGIGAQFRLRRAQSRGGHFSMAAPEKGAAVFGGEPGGMYESKSTLLRVRTSGQQVGGRRSLTVISSLGGANRRDRRKDGSGLSSGAAPVERSGRWRTPVAASEYAESMKIYDVGLKHIRTKRYPSARRLLRACQEKHPTFERAWVTLAQMEKKVNSRKECEIILKSGLWYNPRSAAILQAWGLHLLQDAENGNDLMAYGLLKAAAEIDPSLKNVLNWKQVREIGQRWRAERQSRSRLRTLRALDSP